MEYTPFILCVIGLAGIFIHHLVKIDSLNRLNEGTIHFGKYLAVEWASILINFIIVLLVSFILNKELHAYLQMLDFLKYFVGFAMFTIGYAGQSLLVKAMGKGQRHMEKLDKKSSDKTIK